MIWVSVPETRILYEILEARPWNFGIQYKPEIQNFCMAPSNPKCPYHSATSLLEAFWAK